MTSVTAKLLAIDQRLKALDPHSYNRWLDRSYLRCHCVNAYMATRSGARRSPTATGRLPVVAFGSFRWLQLRGHWHYLAHERFLITKGRAVVAPSVLGGTVSDADWLWCLVHEHDVGALNHENHQTQSMSQRPLFEMHSVCLLRRPAVLIFVSLGDFDRWKPADQ